jgi:hypothetical protein
MISNLERYKKDLENLISVGHNLLNSMQYECFPDQFEKEVKKEIKDDYPNFIKSLPNFSSNYQEWYSESLLLIKQLLPDRLADFIRLYEKPKTKRKDITYENYTIEDYLQGLTVTTGWEKKVVVGPYAAVPLYKQQFNILKAIQKRFTSSLFDIRQLVQADLFDTELDTARELHKNGFLRGAGAIAGVILEKHLSQVCANHSVKVSIKPTIAIYNDKLKEDNVYETATWRKIQYLGDLRNLCDHDKKKEPKSEEVINLIDGVEEIIKNIY